VGASTSPPPLPARDEFNGGGAGFDTLVHRQFMNPSPAVRSPAPARNSSSPTSPASSSIRPVHRKTSTWLDVARLVYPPTKLLTFRVSDSTGGQPPSSAVKKISSPASSSSGELVDKAYIDAAIAQLEQRMQQQLVTLVSQVSPSSLGLAIARLTSETDARGVCVCARADSSSC
jgi:hypothetical protein